MKRILLAVVLFHWTALAAVAQSGVGSITGSVQDSTGAVLPGVAITLINPGTVGGEQIRPALKVHKGANSTA